MKVKRLISFVAVVSFVTGLITPNPVYAGKTPDEWNIDREKAAMPNASNQFASKSEVEVALSSGSAGYSYPITVPEGKGIKPNVSLVYSSSQTYGKVGVGWDLVGDSYIERSTNYGAPGYNNNDTFVYCSGGSQVELVKVHDGTYREEKENSFSKYEYSGGSWTITDTSGTKYYYGEDASSRIDLLEFNRWSGCDSNTFRWYISKSEDLDGNEVKYVYAEGDGLQSGCLFKDNTPKLSEISYVNGTRKILFEYEDMFASDETKGHQIRFVGVKEPVCNTKKLKRIITECNGELKKYELIYTESVDTGRILLAGIILSENDYSETIASELEEIEDADAQITSFEYTSFGGGINYEGPFSVDISEILKTENITDFFFPGKHTNYPNYEDTHGSYSNRQFMDVNNDGLPDIVTYNENSPVLRFYILEKNGGEYTYRPADEYRVNPPTIMKGTGIDHYVHAFKERDDYTNDIEKTFAGVTSEMLTIDIDGRPIHLMADGGGISKKVNLSAPRHRLSYFDDNNAPDNYIPHPHGMDGLELTLRDKIKRSNDTNSNNSNKVTHYPDQQEQGDEGTEDSETGEQDGENYSEFVNELEKNGLFGRMTFKTIKNFMEENGNSNDNGFNKAPPEGSQYISGSHSQDSVGLMYHGDINGDGILDMLIPWYPRSDEDQLPVSGDDRFVEIYGNDSGYFYAFLGRYDIGNGSSLSDTPISWAAPGSMTKLNKPYIDESIRVGNHTTFSHTFGWIAQYIGNGNSDTDIVGEEYHDSAVTYLDMNGDGLKDLIRGQFVHYNTGYGFLDTAQTYPESLGHKSFGWRGKSVFFAEDDGEYDRRDDLPDTSPDYRFREEGKSGNIYIPPDRYEDILKEVPGRLSLPVNNLIDYNGDGIPEIIRLTSLLTRESPGIIGRFINNANIKEVTSVEYISTVIPQIDFGFISEAGVNKIPAVNLTLSLLPRSWPNYGDKTFDWDHPLVDEDGRVQRDYTWTQSTDMNGDRLPDYVVGGLREMFVYEMSKATGNANQADLLLSVKNLAGSVTAIEYGTPLHCDSRVCSRPVVKTIKKWNGVNGDFSTDERIDYTYSGGSWDPVEKEFTGFKQVAVLQKVNTPDEEEEEITKCRNIRFHTEDKYLRGRIKSEIFHGTGGTKQEILNEWEVKELEFLDIKFPVLKAHEEQYYTTENPILGRYKRIEYVYGDFGNVTEIRERGRPEIPNDGYIKKIVYSTGHLDKWLVNLKVRESIYIENENDDKNFLSRVEYEYDDNGKITTETHNGDSGNISKAFTYYADGNLWEETDYNRNITTYYYDTNGVFCTRIDKPNDNYIEWEYTPEGLLVSETVTSGHKVSYIYDYFGRLKEESEDGVLIAEYAYTTNGRSEGVNKIETFKLSCLGDDGFGTIKLVSTEYLDGFGRVYKTEKESAAGQIIQTNLYDNGGRLIKTSIPKFDDDPTDLGNTTFYYDIFDRAIKTVFADGRTTTSEYQHNPISLGLERTDTDPNGNRKVYYYDVFNNLVKVEERVILRGRSGRKRHVGEAEGLEKLKDWIKSRKTIKNRKNGLKDRSIKGFNPKNLNGKVKVGITTGDYNGRSDLIDMLNPNPRTVVDYSNVFNNDSIGRGTIGDWDGISGNSETIPSTDNLQNHTNVPYQPPASIEDIQDGNPPEGQPDISEIHHDLTEVYVHTPEPTTETNPGDLREINPSEFMNHRDYRENLSRTEQPFERRFIGNEGTRPGQRENTRGTGNTWRTPNVPAEKPISQNINLPDREHKNLFDVSYAQGESSTGGSGGVKVVTEYHYDQLGRLVKIIDAKGNTWEKGYNLLGRLNWETHPDKGKTSYTYDHNGNCIAIYGINSSGEYKETTNRAYDALNRVIEERYTKINEPASEIKITYHYDNYNGIDLSDLPDLPSGFVQGRLAYITQTKGGSEIYTKIFEYDLAGRITETILMVNIPDRNGNINNNNNYYYDKTYRTQIEYNTDGSVHCVTYPDNFTTAVYKYTLPGLVYQIDFTHTTDSRNYTLGFEFTYNAHGKVTGVTQTSATPDDNFGVFGTTTTYNYDMVRSIIRELTVTSFDEDSTEKTIFSAEYGFDSNGNITSLNSTYPHGAYNWIFTYDSLNRLILANEGGNTAAYYAYDKIGNITERNGNWYHYDNNKPHAVRKTTTFPLSDSVEFEYDDFGRLIEKGGDVLNYDAMGRLETYNNGRTDICRNWYDNEGNRIMKQSRKGDEYYTTVYVGKDYEVEIDEDGNPKKAIRHQAPALGRLATIESDENNSVDLRIYHSDHLGSSSVVTNSRNQVVSETVYFPFGDDYPKKDDNYQETEDDGADIDYKYNGKERDETGLYYYGARYYDPELCRFISADPVEGKLTVPQTHNAYSYCINNPLKYIDPDGREFMQPYQEPSYCNLEDLSTIAKILRGIDNWVGLGAGSCDPQTVANSVMPDPAAITTGASASGGIVKKLLNKLRGFFNGNADDAARGVGKAGKKLVSNPRLDPKKVQEALEVIEKAGREAEEAAAAAAKTEAEEAAKAAYKKKLKELEDEILGAQERRYNREFNSTSSAYEDQVTAWDEMRRLWLEREKTH